MSFNLYLCASVPARNRHEKSMLEVTSEQLEAVSGGGCGVSRKCPNCGTKDIEKEKWLDPNTMGMGAEYAIRYWKCKCNKCGHEWKDDYYWKG